MDKQTMSTHYYNQGVECGHHRQDKEAIDNYTKAIELNPKDFEAWGNRGVCYSNLGDWDNAILNIAQSVKINSQSIHSLNLPEMYYFRLKNNLKKCDYDKVIADCGYFIENFPNYFLMKEVCKILDYARKKIE